MFRVNNFDKLLDKATSNLRLDTDWPTILEICDLIRQNDCTAKYAVTGIKKKLYSQNPHQAMFALLTLESVVKNCGSGIHDEVASKAFCESLRDLVKTTQHENLRTKILELIQAWAFAFRNTPKYRAVQDTVNILKAEGFKFPALKESDAMFSADTAPEWADGEVCHRCRVAFSLMVRRHHCRACGQVFCQQCSSKTSTLPKFGIEKEVRVCDACFDKVSRPPSSTAKLDIVDPSSDYGPTQPQPSNIVLPQKRPPGTKTAEELQEEEELQLALALSQSEAEQKEKQRGRRTLTHIAPDPVPHHHTASPTPSSVSASPEHAATHSELSRYLDRGYWEQRMSRDPAPPTAPAPASTSSVTTDNEPEYAKPLANKSQDDDAQDKEIDEFVETLKSQVEIFVNRMKSNSSRGRAISNDTSVQTLFMNITAMHSRLLRYIQEQDDKRGYLESLQDKVNQVRDSRAALDTLRAEHMARLAAQAEAAERQRQMQMATKLQAMRKKKHEYLQYQRQLALQRVQEQEREMQIRQEQQKHQYMMSANNFYMPGVSMHQFQPGYNQPIYSSAQYLPQMIQNNDSSFPVGQPMSQANVPMAPVSQSMTQQANAFPISTSGMTLAQAQMGIPSPLNQPNLRPNLNQQQQMILQQMQQLQQLRQPGIHQMMPQSIANGLPGQNINSQAQLLAKQNVPGQPMTLRQPNMNQPIINPSNQILGMQMQNMRMAGLPGQNTNQQYPNNVQNPHNSQQSMQLPGQPMQLPAQQIMQNATQPSTMSGNPTTSQSIPQGQQSQMSTMQVPNMQQMMMPGQHMNSQGPMINQMHQMQIPQQQLGHGQQIPLMMQGQVPPQAAQMQSQIPQQLQQQIPQSQPMPQGPVSQNQVPQGQPMPQGQQIPQGQQMPQGQPMQQGQQPMQQGHHLPQGQQLVQGQPQMQQGQQVPQGPQMLQGQQMPQGQQIPQGQQLPQGQQMPQSQQVPQGQQTAQAQPILQGQPLAQVPQMPQGQQMPQNIPAQIVKMQQPNSNNGQGPTNIKSENNNNTAELIKFD